jgi:GTP-binding protein Era
MGFVSLVGRPNVGKSSLLNAMCGGKVSIVSDKPQTTRTRIRGILTRPDSQVVFVDTPGLHKAVTALGETVNATALESTSDVDLSCLVIDATQDFGSGDRWVADRLDMSKTIVVVNKVDKATPAQVLKQLRDVGSLNALAYFPVSAVTGDGLEEMLADITSRLPEGDALYPAEMITETPKEVWIAELVREQLLAVMHDELPYSIATRVTEFDDRHVRCEIVVERESQKGMVIGKGGAVLAAVRSRVKGALPKGVALELIVVVDKNWQHRHDRVERMGY